MLPWIYIVFNSSILKLGTYTQVTQLQHLEGESPGWGNILLKLAGGDVQEGNCPSGEMSVRGDVRRGKCPTPWSLSRYIFREDMRQQRFSHFRPLTLTFDLFDLQLSTKICYLRQGCLHLVSHSVCKVTHERAYGCRPNI